jgi:hypothetical protein
MRNALYAILTACVCLGVLIWLDPFGAASVDVRASIKAAETVKARYDTIYEEAAQLDRASNTPRRDIKWRVEVALELLDYPTVEVAFERFREEEAKNDADMATLVSQLNAISAAEDAVLLGDQDDGALAGLVKTLEAATRQARTSQETVNAAWRRLNAVCREADPERFSAAMVCFTSRGASRKAFDLAAKRSLP